MATHGVKKGVIMKGLPFSTTKDDIKAFFKTITIPDENIRILSYRDGKATGLAFVTLSSQEDITHACLMDKNHLGPRYVDVIASDEVEMYQLVLETRTGTAASRLYRMAGASNKSGGSGSRDESESSGTRDRSPIRPQLNTRFCYITGIPPGNNYKEVRRFLDGCLIGRNCIHLCKGARGVFRGDGYVEFANSTECLKGLQMSGRTMSGSIVELEPCTEDEVEEYLSADHGRSSGGDRRRDRTPSPVRKRKRAYEATYGREHDRSHYEHGGGGRDRDHVRDREHEQDRLRTYSDRYLEQQQREQRQYSQPYDSRTSSSYANQYAKSGSEGSTYYSSASQLHEELYPQTYMRQVHQGTDGYSTTAYSQVRGGGGSQQPNPLAAVRGVGVGAYAEEYSGVHHTPQAPVGMVEDPGAVPVARERNMVRMEGLSYDITVHDVLEFFRGFHLDFEHVRIQCRDDGSPSGKAFVLFSSEKHARLAVMDYNKKYIGGRYVELFLV